MHIQEGFLTTPWAGAWYGVAVIFIGRGLRDIAGKARKAVIYKPLIGMMGAAVFIMSLFPIPVPYGTTSHPAGTPMAAVLLGPWAGAVLSVVSLVLQAVFFAHGGISTLGANVVSMGVVGTLASFGIFKLCRSINLPLGLAAGVAGFLGDLGVYMCSSAQLALGIPGNPFGSFGKGFVTFLGLYMPTQLPIAVLEGLVTAGVVTYMAKVRPDILINLHVLPGDKGEKNDARN